MKFTSLKARRRDATVQTHQLEEGDFVIWYVDEKERTARMYYRPPGVNWVYSAPLTLDESRADKRGEDGTYWWWNGDYDNPTCKPSFGVPASPPYAWHGWLRDGHWVACE